MSDNQEKRRSAETDTWVCWMGDHLLVKSQEQSPRAAMPQKAGIFITSS